MKKNKSSTICGSQELFSILADKNGNPISKEDFEKMNREHLVLLLQEYIKKMVYIHKNDRLALCYIANSLLRSLKEANR